MKLFVWADPYRVSWGSSLLIAVAETEEQAREQARRAAAYKYGHYDNNKGVNKSIPLGSPIRVVDLPCAEWHEWSE